MALLLETKPKVDVVTLLSDVDIEWLSLVKHAATARPFQLRKAANKGDDMAFQRIQAIIVPKDADIEALKSEFGEDWFKGLNLENPEEFTDTIRYTLAEKSEFKEDTLDAVPIKGIENGLFYVGELRDAEKAESTIAAPINPMNVQIPVSDANQPVTESFGEIYWRKSNAFESRIRDILELYPDAAKRKKNAKEALDAFGQWLMEAIDILGNTAMKMEKPDPTKDLSTKLDKVLRAVKAKNTATKGESEMSDELLQKISDAIGGLAEKTEKNGENIEELKKAVIAMSGDGDTKPEDKKPDETQTGTEKTEKPNEGDVSAQILEQIKQLAEKTEKSSKDTEELRKTVTEIAEKQQSLEHSTTQTATPAEDTQTKGTAKKSEQPATCFDGIPGLPN
jgi:hypothetical protein